jgi:hypothetical protein
MEKLPSCTPSYSGAVPLPSSPRHERWDTSPSARTCAGAHRARVSKSGRAGAGALDPRGPAVAECALEEGIIPEIQQQQEQVVEALEQRAAGAPAAIAQRDVQQGAHQPRVGCEVEREALTMAAAGRAQARPVPIAVVGK